MTHAIPERREVAAFILEQMKAPWHKPSDPTKNGAWHYGKVELRELMDFIYGPLTDPQDALGKTG